MLTNNEYSFFEILVIDGGRNLAEHYLQLLIEGYFDTEIQKLKVEAKQIFEYVGLNANSKL